MNKKTIEYCFILFKKNSIAMTHGGLISLYHFFLVPNVNFIYKHKTI